ncbi:hypothetical protein HDV06_002838 [Boothiomyces sp. JEL0866]|nr:hypothetical protein HDV06_002838 [Boothiomyces sp. JEL0866]
MKILRQVRGHSTTINQIPIQMSSQAQLPCKISPQIVTPKIQKIDSRNWRKDPKLIANIIEQTLRANQPILFHDMLEIDLKDLTKILKLYLKYQDLTNAINLSKRFEINELAYNLLFQIWISTDCFPSTRILLDKFKQLGVKPSEIYLLNLIKSLKRQRRYQEISEVLPYMDEFKDFPFLKKEIKKQDYRNSSNQFKLMLCDYMKSIDICEYFYFPSFEMKASLIASVISSRQHLEEISSLLQKENVTSKDIKNSGDEKFPGEFRKQQPRLANESENNENCRKYINILGDLINQKVPISCYSRLINAFLSINHYHNALIIYQICLKHFKPNPYVIHPFIVYFIKRKELYAGIQFYDNYLKNGGYPTTQLLSALMKLALNSNEIVDLYHQSKRFNSSIHYNLIFTHLLLRRDFEQLKITSDLNHYNYLELAKVLKQQKRTRKVVNLFQQMTEKGVPHTPTSLILLLDSLNDRKELKKIEFHIKQNRDLSMQIFNHIALIFARNGQYNKAALMLNRKKDLKTYLQIQAMFPGFSSMVEESDTTLEPWYRELFGESNLGSQKVQSIDY